MELRGSQYQFFCCVLISNKPVAIVCPVERLECNIQTSEDCYDNNDVAIFLDPWIEEAKGVGVHMVYGMAKKPCSGIGMDS